MQYKSMEFKLDDVDSQGIIRGYASTFGNIDLVDDIIDKGAFKKTLKENKGRFPILDSHDPSSQIGWNLRAEENEHGLFVEGKIELNVQKGKEKYALAKQAVNIGAPMGLSIGFSIVKSLTDDDRPRVRRIKELKLYEYSIVTFPANPMAQITEAKSYNEKFDQAKLIINEGLKMGLSREDIIKALRENEAADLDNEPNHDDVHSFDDLINIFK